MLSQPYLHAYSRAVYERLGRRHPLPKPTTDLEMCGLKPPNYEQRFSNAQAALALRQLRRLGSGELPAPAARLEIDRQPSGTVEMTATTGSASARPLELRRTFDKIGAHLITLRLVAASSRRR